MCFYLWLINFTFHFANFQWIIDFIFFVFFRLANSIWYIFHELPPFSFFSLQIFWLEILAYSSNLSATLCYFSSALFILCNEPIFILNFKSGKLSEYPKYLNILTIPRAWKLRTTVCCSGYYVWKWPCLETLVCSVACRLYVCVCARVDRISLLQYCSSSIG